MASDNPFKIHLEVFEGPLDLLLYLVKQNEVDIYEVFIEKVVNDYLQYLEAMRELNLEIAGDFLVMAATLMHIKSRTLLPQDQQTPEEEAEEDDPRWELIRQLIEYRKFKEAAEILRKREELQESLFPRNLPPEELAEFSPMPLAEISLMDLIHAFRRILKRIESQSAEPREIYAENFTVSEKMDAILAYVRPGIAIRFEELFHSAASRAEVVVTFLAMLELIRLKQLSVRQDVSFGDIWLERNPVAFPPPVLPVESAAA